MCGIVAAVSTRDIVPVLIEGLRRLEYRGYDSCGVALHAGDRQQRARSTARVADLAGQVRAEGLAGFTGIAHTRWATHGAPRTDNAHPHFSPDDTRPRIALVHNGIVENHEALREELVARGYLFRSQTDTEVIVHLVDHLYDGDLLEAVRGAVARLRGAYAIAAFCGDEPHRVVGARSGSPLVVGVGEHEGFLASDTLALAGVTERFVHLRDGDVVDLQLGRHWIVDADGRPAERPVQVVRAHAAAVDLGPYRHYMQKEIFEQPRALADPLEGVEATMPELFGDTAWRTMKDVDSV
ncbi:MAG: glutamine--fructose-6-phosphate aminotransferase, partial [Burkholderiales bacterium]